MTIDVPALSLVVLVGASGSGKSTFARLHFLPTEVISSDFCRGLVSDDENDQAATKDAFEVLNFIAGKRLAAGRLTVIDATNVQPEARKELVNLAREYDVLPVAIVLDPPRLPALAHSVFRTAHPAAVVVTTPNSEYNVRFPSLPAGNFRHPDHRFEWTRAEFRSWATEVAERYTYAVEFRAVGAVDPEVGPPTQLALFRREDAR